MSLGAFYLNHGDEMLDITDTKILAAVTDNNGGRTHHIAARLGVLMSYSKLRRRLLRLERAGKIGRDPRYTYANSIYWRVEEKIDA